MSHASAASAPPGPRTGDPILEARDVTVRFGGLVALDRVDLAVHPGTLHGVIGPNGAGKTTLFGVLSGLLRPAAGEVLLAGEQVTRSTPEARARRGLARTFQQVQLFAELSVREHLVLARRVARDGHRLLRDLFTVGSRGDEDEDAAVDRVLDQLGLAEVAGRAAADLPLGTGRLVEVGRALVAEPRVLLLDEPSSGLDSQETEQLAATLVAACRGGDMALVLVEHDLELVLGLCDHVDVLDFGRVIASDTPARVRDDRAVQSAYIGGGEGGG